MIRPLQSLMAGIFSFFLYAFLRFVEIRPASLLSIDFKNASCADFLAAR